jgi:hypothetical protein
MNRQQSGYIARACGNKNYEIFNPTETYHERVGTYKQLDLCSSCLLLPPEPEPLKSRSILTDRAN